MHICFNTYIFEFKKVVKACNIFKYFRISSKISYMSKNGYLQIPFQCKNYLRDRISLHICIYIFAFPILITDIITTINNYFNFHSFSNTCSRSHSKITH